MMWRRRFPLLLLLAAALGLAAVVWQVARQPSVNQVGLSAPAPADISGFARADGPQPILFPEDLGPHPDYQTEWWYYTGNLATPTGRRFGFQLTFFRRALLPPDQRVERESSWAADQAYMAHFTLSDIDAGQFQAFERIERGASNPDGASNTDGASKAGGASKSGEAPNPGSASTPGGAIGLAGAQAVPYRVWLGSWRVEEDRAGQVRLFAEAPEGEPPVRLELELVEQKAPVLQGQQGFSPKGADAGQASFYFSQTRLGARGTLQLGGETFELEGLAWQDHEWSTSALAQEQVGWDWFSIQLDNQSELMFFQIRRSDGSIDPYSSGALVLPDGQTIPLQQADFSIEITDRWESPHTGAAYPAGWRVRLPGHNLDLEITPLLADQELNLSYSYWEGAAAVRGSSNGQPVQGYGYIELTGYSRAMGGEF